MLNLEFRNAALQYGRKTVVHDINWQLRSDENWAFIGLNGCGKTTLLSMMAGYAGCTAGTLFCNGEAVTSANRQALRMETGFVSSSFFNRIFSREQVLDIILSGKTGTLQVGDSVTLADVQKARELMAIFGLEDYLRYSYDMLSNGQRQCVLLSRALMKENRMLILDEPCEGLDVMRRDLFLQQIQEISAHSGIVYVTHHMEELSDMFGMAAFMKDGTIHSAGKYQEMFTSEKLQDFFGRKVDVEHNNGRLFLKFDWQHGGLQTGGIR